MTLQQIAADKDYSVRTQISLSPSLYKAIKQCAKREGKSLAEIARESLLLKLQSDTAEQKDQQAKLRQLVSRTKGSISSGDSGWGRVVDPVRYIKSMREKEESREENGTREK